MKNRMSTNSYFLYPEVSERFCCDLFENSIFSCQKVRKAVQILLPSFIASLAAVFLFCATNAFGAGLQQGNRFRVKHRNSQITVEGVITPMKALPLPFSKKARPFLSVDNGYSRTLIPNHETEDGGRTPTKFKIEYKLDQKVASYKTASITYTPVVLTPNQPFDQYGRRFIQAKTHLGVKTLMQGIVKITPEYAQVKGIQLTGRREFEAPFNAWLSTSSIDSTTLVKILRNATVDLKSKDERLKIVLFLLSAKRHLAARTELRRMLLDIPKFDSSDQYKDYKKEIADEIAQTSITELQRRDEAGQRRIVKNLLDNFDSSEVSASVLQKFNSFRKSISNQDLKLEKLKSNLSRDFDIVIGDKRIPKLHRDAVKEIKTEILKELNLNNSNRMSNYIVQSEDKSVDYSQRVAFAINGWFLGSDLWTKKLAQAIEVAKLKDLIVAYLKEDDKKERDAILYKIERSEASAVENIAAIALRIKPWKDNSDAVADNRGFLRIKMKGLPDQPDMLVSLPPEYDPYRKYPCILAVCDTFGSPVRQIGWWKSQADRNGYIVVAPDWRQKNKPGYDYSSHAATTCLAALRDAKRRLSIDSDSVFITGHMRGAEAALDIGLSHPDLWAGIVNFSTIADKYLPFYKNNIRNRVAVYSVVGELHNAPQRAKVGLLDKREMLIGHWMDYGKINAVTVVYKGRQAEYFYEEIHRVFNWFTHQKRRFTAQDNDFNVNTMRRWDNFFWWFEINNYPERFHLSPFNWNFRKSKKDLSIEGKNYTNAKGQTVLKVVQGAASNHVTFWLSPKWVNFNEPIQFQYGTAKKTTEVEPNKRVIMEDLRSRCDVQNPFWASFSYKNKSWIPNSNGTLQNAAGK